MGCIIASSPEPRVRSFFVCLIFSLHSTRGLRKIAIQQWLAAVVAVEFSAIRGEIKKIKSRLRTIVFGAEGLFRRRRVALSLTREILFSVSSRAVLLTNKAYTPSGCAVKTLQYACVDRILFFAIYSFLRS